MTLPTDAAARKAIPVYSGFIKYFPRGMIAVAQLSKIGNDQHNPGKPLHWDRSKSGDEMDALTRHMLDDAMGVPTDTDGVLHATKLAWRAMANLEKVLEKKEAGLDTRNGLSAAEQDNDWIAHDGGEMPCDPGCFVDVCFKSGFGQDHCIARFVHWPDTDLVKWRPSKKGK
jgi:hypothetical protein